MLRICNTTRVNSREAPLGCDAAQPNIEAPNFRGIIFHPADEGSRHPKILVPTVSSRIMNSEIVCVVYFYMTTRKT
jgi:hypothetical protein